MTACSPSTEGVFAAALRFATEGKPVFPCDPETKRPLTKKGFYDASTDTAQIKKWWTRWPSAMIGMPTGQVSGLFAIDLDGEEGLASWSTLVAEHDWLEPLPETASQDTPSGGKHLLFEWPGSMVKNSASKLARNIDVRGDGGYIIVAPSRRADGREYRMTCAAKPAQAPQWLLALVSKPLAKEKKPLSIPPEKPGVTTPYGLAALMQEAGKVTVAPEGQRNGALNEAAFALGQLVGGSEADEGTALAALQRAGRAAGLPDGEIDATVRSGFEAGRKEPRTAMGTHPVAAGASKSEAGAEAPIKPVSFDTLNVPDVDPELLPPILGEFCEAVAEGLQVPFELVLINALACVAVAGQRKFKVQVRQDYTEPVNIYALAALPPGERKSATAEACKRPLIDWETEAQEEARENIRNTLSERKTLEKAIEAKRAKAGNAKTAEDRRALIDEIKALEAELPEVPAAPRLLIDDVTPEAIPAFMERQQERAGIIEAEGGLFDILAGRYSKGVPNLDAVLKFWSGEAVHVDRRSGQNIVLHDPALTICLSPQPEVVRGLADKPGFRGRGLLGRFLFLLPRSRVGSREVEPRPIPQAVQVRYAAKVRGLLALPWALGTDGKATSYHILLAPDAYREWLDFHRDVEAELRPGGELELIADWGGKLHGAAARLAGLLHLVEHEAPHRHPIGLGTMQQALGLAAVLTEHAKAAFALMGADPDIECAKHILAWIVDRRIDAFQAREAFQAVKGRYSKMEPVKAGLTILEDRAVIFPAQVQTREPGKAGRPASPGYTVNPLALGGAI